MKKLSLYIIPLIAMLTTVSCGKEILDKAPLDAVSDKDVFATPENTTLFVNSIYAGLPNGFERGWYMFESGSGDAENSYAWTASHMFNRGDYDPTNTPNNDWSSSYRQITNCNVFFANIDNVTGDDALITRLKGEVHFLRAFYYFELYKRFGGVPLISTVLTLEDDFLQDRASADEVVDFILGDLDKAAENLPAKYSGNDIGRASRVAALSLKGRTLLYAGKNQESATASKLAIDEVIAAGYDLHAPYDKIFLDNNNSEIIFDKQLLAKNCSGYQDLFNAPVGGSYGGWGGTCPTQNLVDAYDMKTSGKPITDPASGYNPQNPFADRDPRFDYSILHNGSTWKAAIIDTKENGVNKPNGNGDATKTGYYLRKFMDESVLDPNAVCGKAHWILIRLAEVYLNYAEAQLKLNNPEEAVIWVNKLRERAEMPALQTSDLTWDRYMKERRVELAFEEHRFWDVRRWKVAEVTENEAVWGMKIEEIAGVLKYTPYKWEDRFFDPSKHYLFPIPQSERDKNPNLSQNPGW